MSTGFRSRCRRGSRGTASSGATEGDRRLIGRTLGRAHAALLAVPAPELDRFHWLDPGAAHLAARPWVRSAVAGAVAAYDAADPAGFTWGPLHGDPAPEAFRSDPATGRRGLIDWGSAVRGPLLYDLASAAMYVGGAARAGDLIEAYLEGRTVTAAEVERGLPVMSRFRWAVQADYFAHRLATGDLTGVSDGADNERGLEDARRALLEPSS